MTNITNLSLLIKYYPILIFYIFVIILLSYLLGSIPFGLILSKILKKGDLRKIGSGNIGATNAMRAGGFKLAFLVWLFDMLKAFIAVKIGIYFLGIYWGGICGVLAILGHMFPLWLKFKGGKGVSCMFGVILAINPIYFLILALTWILSVIITSYSSLSAILCFFVLPILGFFKDFKIGVLFLIISILCLIKHKDNIKRLLKGTESKVNWKKKINN